MVTLYINPSSTKCGACGKGATYREKSHQTIVEYGPKTGSPGCGAVWTHLSSEYTDFDGLYDKVKAIRPDLIPDFPVWGPPKAKNWDKVLVSESDTLDE